MKLIHILGPAMLYTNTFLVLTEAGHAIAIDPAADPQEYLDMLEKHHGMVESSNRGKSVSGAGGLQRGPDVSSGGGGCRISC